MSRDNIIQGYSVEMALKHGIAVAIIYEKVNFWGNRGTRDDGWVYKTYDEMTSETALSTKQIRLAYEKLRNAGVIETKTMKVGTVPKMHFRLVQKDKSIERAKRTSPILYTGKTQNMVANAKSDSLFKKKKELLDLVNKTTGRAFRVLPEKGAKKTIDAFTLVEMESALRALAADEWHKDKLKELSIDYLIRSTTIDKFLGIAQKKAYRDPRVYGKL